MGRVMQYFIFVFLFVYCFALSLLTPLKAATVNNLAHFLVITDIHFNPFFSCKLNQPNCQIALKLKNSGANKWKTIFNSNTNHKLSTYYQDTSYTLLKSSLHESKKLDRKFQLQFIINPGDFLAHNFCQQYVTYTGDNTQAGCDLFAKKTMKFLAQQLKSTFPNTPLYAALGNNDSYTGDYSIQPGGRFLSETAVTWSRFFKNQTNKIHFLTQFLRAGYYEITPPNSLNDRIIILNTTPFSPQALSNANLNQIALAEFNWLNRRLQAAQIFHRKVWIVLHIPVGIDVYASQNAKKIVPYWKKPYTKIFLRLLERYNNVINGLFAGHTHMDMFNVINKPNEKHISQIVSPSISPIFGNNPGLKLFTYNMKKFQAEDYVVYGLSLNAKFPSWQKEYDFDKTYAPQSVQNKKGSNLSKLLNQVANSRSFRKGKLATIYQHNYTVNGAPNSPILRQYKNYWCEVRHVDSKSYERCVNS